MKKQYNTALYNYLSKFNTSQFKFFYCMFVHYIAKYRYFISNYNLFNLHCELNQFCHEFDVSFPDQYDNYDEMKSFCKAYPYYFIDKLPIDLIAKLFAEYTDDRVNILSNIAKILYEKDIYAAYTYANTALNLDESIEVLVAETQDHIKYFS